MKTTLSLTTTFRFMHIQAHADDVGGWMTGMDHREAKIPLVKWMGGELSYYDIKIMFTEHCTYTGIIATMVCL